MDDDNILPFPVKDPAAALIEGIIADGAAEREALESDISSAAKGVMGMLLHRGDGDHDYAVRVLMRTLELLDARDLQAKADRILGPCRGFDGAA